MSGRSVEDVTADIENQLAGIDIPFEYHMEVLSNNEGLQVNQSRLIAIALAAFIGIYLLMQAAFSSWKLSIIVFLTLPMALVGGVLAALIAGGSLSFAALFGFFGLIAIAVRNGLILVNHLRKAGEFEDKSDGAELVLNGAQDRLTAILMTAVITTLALLPVLLGGNIGGSEIIRPMAGIIVGGLITSTIYNLFVVPALYLRWPSPVPAAGEPVISEGPAPAPEAAFD